MATHHHANTKAQSNSIALTKSYKQFKRLKIRYIIYKEAFNIKR